jgi:hypothetical protein
MCCAHVVAALQMLIATTGNGWIVPLQLKADSLGKMSAVRADTDEPHKNHPAFWACWYTNTSNTSGITNSGGTGDTRSITQCVWLRLHAQRHDKGRIAACCQPPRIRVD